MKPLLLALALAALVAPAAASLKTLPPDEQAALAEGAGAGMAKPAELNGYPGPRHVLELAEDLKLTAEQRRATEAVFRAMQTNAAAKGGEVLRLEAELDRLYAERRAEPETVAALVREIANLRGELRLIHLAAHFDMAKLLTAEQTQAYMRLRGHAAGPGEGRRHKH